jgi:protein gp37
MGANSSIEWTESTWNPVTGCAKISEGCKNCYAERMTKRLKAMGQPNYANGFNVTIHPHTLTLPLSWKKPQMIFVNSMSDLFHDDVPTSYIKNVFDVMSSASWHQFQVLTKRAARLQELSSELIWSQNIWMGVSVENNNNTFRIDHLKKTGATIKFVSFEPLIGPIQTMDLKGIDWAIVGGESGPGARPMMSSWATSIRDQCLRDNIAFFFKQWGGVNKKKNGRTLEGSIWDQMPAASSM